MKRSLNDIAFRNWEFYDDWIIGAVTDGFGEWSAEYTYIHGSSFDGTKLSTVTGSADWGKSVNRDKLGRMT